MPHQRDYVLQINPDVYNISEALVQMPVHSRELVLNDGNKKPYLEKGRRVYLWVSGGRGLVGRGTVMEDRLPRSMPTWQHSFFRSPNRHDPNQHKALIRVDISLGAPLSRELLQRDPVLAKATFFKNSTDTQGTVFYVEENTARALEDHLIEP